MSGQSDLERGECTINVTKPAEVISPVPLSEKGRSDVIEALAGAAPEEGDEAMVLEALELSRKIDGEDEALLNCRVPRHFGETTADVECLLRKSENYHEAPHLIPLVAPVIAALQLKSNHLAEYWQEDCEAEDRSWRLEAMLTYDEGIYNLMNHLYSHLKDDPGTLQKIVDAIANAYSHFNRMPTEQPNLLDLNFFMHPELQKFYLKEGQLDVPVLIDLIKRAGQYSGGKLYDEMFQRAADGNWWISHDEFKADFILWEEDEAEAA